MSKGWLAEEEELEGHEAEAKEIKESMKEEGSAATK